MHILLTGAGSSLAYQLLPMLAAGDVIKNESLTLVLCDGENVQNELQEVAQELRDCLYPSVSGVHVTRNFCEACKTADIILVLPRSSGNHSEAGNSVDRPREQLAGLGVELGYSMLSQIDFSSLNYGMHPCQVLFSVECKGYLSAAMSICDYIRDLHLQNLKEIETETQLRHEEAKFGCPPACDFAGLKHCECHLHIGLSSLVEKQTLLVLVSAYEVGNTTTELPEDSIEKTYVAEDFSRLYARL